MTALGREIRDMIAADGPMSVERFMQLCLQHPHLGYYTTRASIGRDFTTAPEVSQIFGELVGLWAAQVWLDAGAPRPVRLVELGPGRGTLMADALRATRVVRGFHEAIRVDLVETSPRLRAAQKDRLAGVAPHLAWYDAIEDVPPGPALVLANEFFDALPVRHYVSGADGWHERLVGLGQDGALVFGAAREPIGMAGPVGPPGQVLEVGHAASAVMATLAGRIAREGGGLLVGDYGHAASGFGETLQAMRDGTYAAVLDAPGEADLTAHVDFAALARTAAGAGAVAYGPVTQGTFLRRLGIGERAAALRRGADARQAAAIDSAVDRLAGAQADLPPTGTPQMGIPQTGTPQSSMATLFKFLAVLPPGTAEPPGFGMAAP